MRQQQLQLLQQQQQQRKLAAAHLRKEEGGEVEHARRTAREPRAEELDPVGEV